MKRRPDKTHLGEILHVISDDKIDIGGYHASREQISSRIQMPTEVKVPFKFFIVYRCVFCKIKHISVIKQLCEFIK